MLNRRALITNYTGLGDALILLPLLKVLEGENPGFQYFYIHNPILTIQEWIKWLDIKNLLGLYPVEWRKFQRSYWTDITTFLEEQNIDLIINLRDESRQSNPDYYQYKETMALVNLEFWDMEPLKHHEPRHFTQNILSLFKQQNITISDYDHAWLKAYFHRDKKMASSKRHIGFFTATSMLVKSWSIEHWVELGDFLLHATDSILVVYAGTSPEEIAFARSIVFALYKKYPTRLCKIIVGSSLLNLAESFSTLDLLVTNDTFAVHLSAALDLPTVGLYFATDGRIWGGNSHTFMLIQSSFGLKCPFMKKEEGKCAYYFGGCPSPCKKEVTAQRVYTTISSLFR